MRPVLWRINNLRLFAIKRPELAHNLPPQSFNNKQTKNKQTAFTTCSFFHHMRIPQFLTSQLEIDVFFLVLYLF